MTRQPEVDSWIYFIQEIDDDGTPGFYKIGKANNPDGRANAFQTGNSRHLIIRHREPGGYPEEGAHHRRFRRYRRYVKGRRTEWFDDRDGKIAAYIAAAPRHSAGPRRHTLPSIPVLSAIAWLAAIPRGAWRIITAIILYLFAPRRRRRTRPYALTGALIAAGGTALTHTGLLTPAATVLAIATAVIVACTIAGAARYR